MMGWRRLLQLLPNLHINETFETAEVIRKKVNSESDHACNRIFCLDSLNYAGLWGDVIFPGCRHKRLQLILHWIFGETLHCWTNCISISEVVHAGIESVRLPLELFFPRDAIELQLKTSVMDSWSELNFNMRKVLQNSKSARLLFRQCTSWHSSHQHLKEITVLRR